MNFIGSELKALQFGGAQHNRVDVDRMARRGRFSRGSQKLAEDGDGAVGLGENALDFSAPAVIGRIAEQALGVTEDGGERIAQLVRDAADVLAEGGKPLHFVQLGSKQLLRGEITVNFETPEAVSGGIVNGTGDP